MKYYTLDRKEKNGKVTRLEATEGKKPGTGKKLAEANFVTNSRIGEANAERDLGRKIGKGHKRHKPEEKKPGIFKRIFTRNK